MALTCPRCQREYDVTLFEFGRKIKCICGNILSLEKSNIQEEDAKILEIKRKTDEVCRMILNSDYPEVDIEIQKEKLKEIIREYFPEELHLYELILESRFRRLWEQFR